MIRQATADDLDRVVELGAAFHAYSPHRVFPFDAEAFADFAAKLIAAGGVFLSEDGFCGGLLTPLYFSPETLVAAELFWFAPSEGQALREAFEAWGVANGASAIQFTALVDDHERAIERIYRRAGYARVETGYLKRI
jgi:hypothetical protein